MKHKDDAWADLAIDRLQALIGVDAPDIWPCTVNRIDAPACHEALGRADYRITLRDLCRDPTDRERHLECAPLLVLRASTSLILPDEALPLQQDDEILFAGRPAARSAQRSVLVNMNARDYVVQGMDLPGGWLWQWLTRPTADRRISHHAFDSDAEESASAGAGRGYASTDHTSSRRAAVPPVRRYRVAAMPQPPIPESEAEFVANAERLLRQGEPLLAYNVADTGLQRWPGLLRLRQLLALALARSGDLERANRILADLVRSGMDDAETLGVLARTHKDLGMRAADPARRAAHLESAYRLYRQAYASSRQLGAAADAYYTGINAATVAVLRGELDEARRIAAEVLVVCDAADGSPEAKAEYWSKATRGEALLILGDAAAAARHYAAAMALAPGRYGDLSTTRRQARLLAAHLPVDAGWLEEVLRIPPVLVFSGHRVGRTGHEAACVPAGLESTAREAIRASLAAARPLAAYGSAAGGADILCLELVRELGGETHVVLPFPPRDFRHTIGDGDWGVRFDSLLEKADSVTVASDHRGSVATFEYADLVMTGLGALRAEMLDTDLRGLAISDGEHDGTPNGAWSVVPTWERRGIPISHVRVSGSAPARASPRRARSRPAPPTRSSSPTSS